MYGSRKFDLLRRGAADETATVLILRNEVATHRRNYRNGYRQRRWDNRAGTIDLAIRRLRAGSYFPEWLLERRRLSGR